MRKFSYTFGLFLYICAVLYLGIYPRVRILPVAFDASFIFHTVGFFILYLFLLDRLKHKLLSLLIALLVAILIELLQGYLPSRTRSFADLVYDITGILLALIVGFRGKDVVFKVLASVIGIGYSPIAPGTIASFVFSIVIYLSSRYRVIYVWQISLLLMPISLFVSQKMEDLEGEDPKRCVVDEVLGMSILLVFLKSNPLLYALSFLFFRFFDIVKPFGIKNIERIKGGLGIILDDVVAGVYALFLIKAATFFLSYFGIRF